MPTFGVEPRPRLLISGFPGIAESLSDRFPTINIVDDLRAVDEDEFDVMVTAGEAGSGHRVNQIVVGGGGAPPALPDGSVPIPPTLSFDDGQTTVSKILRVSETLPREIVDIASTRLVPILQRREANRVIRWDDRLHLAIRVGLKLPAVSEIVESFVETRQGEILAGRFDLVGGEAECWYLPNLDDAEVVEWVRVAAIVWQRRFPEMFPMSSRWIDSATWRTPSEEEIHTRLVALRKERETLLARINSLESELEEQLAQATSEADQGPRRLLTASGADLVDAVKSCFEDMGFNTIDMDALQPKGDKVEDLRISDPDAREWLALVEVKGYTRGAKSNDLLYFTKFVAKFRGEPGACWYVVNQFAGQDPSQRPPALSAKEAELATFAETANGLVVDTADLYRLWKAVTTGSIDAGQARALLRGRPGRFVYPDEATE